MGESVPYWNRAHFGIASYQMHHQYIVKMLCMLYNSSEYAGKIRFKQTDRIMTHKMDYIQQASPISSLSSKLYPLVVVLFVQL